jgi:hypothetical protein
MSSCPRYCGWVETYMDGELLPEHVVEFEDHLADCLHCCEEIRFEEARRASTKRAVQETVRISPEFLARVRAAMQEASAEECCAPRGPHKSAAKDRGGLPPGALGWRAVVPLSVAAATALVFAQVQNDRRDPATAVMELSKRHVSMSSTATTDTMASVEEFLDDLTQYYSHAEDPLPVGTVPMGAPVSNKMPRAQLLPDVGLPLQPPELSMVGAVWEGGHLRQSRQGRTTNWHYRVGDHRVVVSVYDSRQVPLRVLLEPRVARNQAVFVGTRGGCAVAAVESNGMGLAATTDLSPLETAELVAAAVH